MREILWSARVAVDPLRAGAGPQNKVLEGGGIPMVITSVANEGIGAEPGENVLGAGGPEGFAQSVVRFLKDSGLSRRLGEKARRFVEENFTWEKH